jgi:hypothetical protein
MMRFVHHQSGIFWKYAVFSPHIGKEERMIDNDQISPLSLAPDPGNITGPGEPPATGAQAGFTIGTQFLPEFLL